MKSLSRAELCEIDRRAIEAFGVPGIVLMENAGRNAAGLVHELWPLGRVAVVCGRGNNAGDGFVIARHLQLFGRDVRILLAAAATSLTGDAAANHRIATLARIPLIDLSAADATGWRGAIGEAADGIIVDALLGTGVTGAPRGTIATAIEAIDAVRRAADRRRVFAVDLPSGLDCDSGEAAGACVHADATGTFVARKIGFDHPAARAFTGDVHVLDIGAPRTLLEEFNAGGGPPHFLPDGRLAPGVLEAMVAQARAASLRAHCPYSGFRVGAVVLADDGTMYAGCNVENVSYGLTICAERSAVARMVASGRRSIVAVCVFTPTKEPVAPCGACRQVLHGFGPDAVVVSRCDGPASLVRRMGELLPDAFGTQAVPTRVPPELP